MEKRVRVALNLPFARFFDYRVEDFTPNDVGRLMVLPFGKGNLPKLGVAVEVFEDEGDPQLKKPLRLFKEIPPFPLNYLDFCRFAARYYHTPWGEVLLGGVPLYFLKNTHLPRAKKGAPAADSGSALHLNPAQKEALTAIESAHNAPVLLFGVTGSGKTEVYFQKIEAVLEVKKQVLLLVPEINLTPQLESRLKARFPNTKIALLHSDLTEAARAREWLFAVLGEAQIILGTRLAIFTPFPNLGLIVVDEEHDPSFKQQEGFRYHARDLAVYRARQLNIPIILGSATPSIESWNNALLKRYVRVDLKERANPQALLPQISAVNLKKIPKKNGFSLPLLEALEERLKKKEQSLVFLNRRGFAPVISCPSCAWMMECEDCSAKMVFHAAEERMRCHHCGRSAFVPRFCPCCGNQDLFPLGIGTERIEENLKLLFPKARILRIDRDSVKTRAQWLEKWNIIQQNEADILVGTQMLSKGHDFQNLTLVGVLGADAALFSGDFRSEERLFSLLTQVAGRAGRAEKKGEVLIETRFVEHPVFGEIFENDFARFAKRECQNRKNAGMPPFVFQAMLRADSFLMEESLDFLKAVQKSFPENPKVLVFDPVPMNLARLAKRERAQMLLESNSRNALHAFLNEVLPLIEKLPKPKNLRYHVEIDPLFL